MTVRHQTKTPARAGVLVYQDRLGDFLADFWARCLAYFLLLLMLRPANFFSKRDRRPPRSISCWLPPVQAGCDFGSMSRCSTSPLLPQVVRVLNSVPSVFLTGVGWYSGVR